MEKKGPADKKPAEKKGGIKKQAPQEEEKVHLKIGNDKDPLAGYEGIKPKKAMNAYSFFNTPNMKKIKNENPDMKQSDIMKQSGAEWQMLSEEEKAKFDDMVEEDKKRYAAQISEIQKRGYFMMDDNVKSCDVKPKVKRSKKSPAKEVQKKKPTDRAKSAGKKDKKKAAESEEEGSEVDVKDSSTEW